MPKKKRRDDDRHQLILEYLRTLAVVVTAVSALYGAITLRADAPDRPAQVERPDQGL